MSDNVYDVYCDDVKMNDELLTLEEAEALVTDLFFEGFKSLFVTDVTKAE